MKRRIFSVEDVFYKVDFGNPDGCWFWLGSLSNKTQGHGVFKINGKQYYIHRAFYSHFIGLIPEGLVIDHLCENKTCVNPFHLEPVTNRENIIRAAENRRYRRDGRIDLCRRGHPMEGYNLAYRVTKNGYKNRYCRMCNTISAVAAKKRKRDNA